MINKTKLQDLTAHLLKKDRGRFTKRELHPTRDWLLGLGIFFALVCIGGLQSAHQFLSYKNVSIAGGTFSEPVTVYNKAAAEKAVTVFTERKRMFGELQKDATAVPVVPTAAAGVATTTVESTSTPQETTLAN